MFHSKYGIDIDIIDNTEDKKLADLGDCIMCDNPMLLVEVLREVADKIEGVL